MLTPGLMYNFLAVTVIQLQILCWISSIHYKKDNMLIKSSRLDYVKKGN